jgi:outer membrane protein
MMKWKVLIGLAIVPHMAAASLQQLATEFLERNTIVVEAKSKIMLAQLDIDAWDSSKTTSVNWVSNYNNNSLESYSAFAAQFAGGAFRLPIEMHTHGVTLAKDFTWGGNLSFENTFNQIQADGTQKIYGFTQGLTFKQNIGRDFFGQNYNLEGEALASSLKASSSQSQSEIDESLIVLIQNYYSASLNKSMVELQSEAEKRALRRLDLIKRRVRDGLREKVDLIQARISLLRAQENIKTAKQNLISNIESLSTSVHRSVDESDIISFTEKKFKSHQISKGNIDENAGLKALEFQVAALEKSLKTQSNNLLPEMNFEASLKNNNYDPRLGDGISGGTFGKPNDEIAVGFNIVWPFGSKPQKVEETKARVKYETAKLKKERLAINVKQIEKSIKDQILVLEENLKSSNSRLKLAQSALKEYTSLYERGRTDLDQLITSEETLIQTQISHVQYQSQREQLSYQLSFLYGILSDDLTGKRGEL